MLVGSSSCSTMDNCRDYTSQEGMVSPAWDGHGYQDGFELVEPNPVLMPTEQVREVNVEPLAFILDSHTMPYYAVVVGLALAVVGAAECNVPLAVVGVAIAAIGAYELFTRD